MTKPKLKIGDVVELKSGSPKMTIYEITSSLASCIHYKDELIITANNIPLDCFKKHQLEKHI